MIQACCSVSVSRSHRAWQIGAVVRLVTSASAHRVLILTLWCHNVCHDTLHTLLKHCKYQRIMLHSACLHSHPYSCAQISFFSTLFSFFSTLWHMSQYAESMCGTAWVVNVVDTREKVCTVRSNLSSTMSSLQESVYHSGCCGHQQGPRGGQEP